MPFLFGFYLSSLLYGVFFLIFLINRINPNIIELKTSSSIASIKANKNQVPPSSPNAIARAGINTGIKTLSTSQVSPSSFEKEILKIPSSI